MECGTIAGIAGHLFGEPGDAAGYEPQSARHCSRHSLSRLRLGRRQVQRVDPLAWSAGVIREGEGLPAGTTPAGFYTTCMVSNQPVETIAYLTLVHHQPCVVITHDQTTWVVENGRITKDQKKK